MNLLVILFVVLIVWGIYSGIKNGLVKSVNGLAALLMALIVLSAVFLLIAGIVEKNTNTIVVAVILLIVISLISRLVNLLMKSLETIAKLPIINLFDKLGGAVIGAAKMLVLFWILYTVIDSFPTGEFGEQIMAWTEQSTLLINIYNKNYIAHWIAGLVL